MLVIGLSANQDNARDRDSMPPDYVQAVLRAGAVPVIFPLIPENQPGYEAMINELVQRCDGFVFTGGPDLDPAAYGEEKLPGCGEILPVRDRMDLTLISSVLASGKPFLGICRGLQAVNVHLGGSLWQDLASQVQEAMPHQQTGVIKAHTVKLLPGTLLAKITGKDSLWVNTRHHQAVKRLAEGLIPCAVSRDGLVEAFSLPDSSGLCVQWHPENLSQEDASHQTLFDWLVRAAGKQSS